MSAKFIEGETLSDQETVWTLGALEVFLEQCVWLATRLHYNATAGQLQHIIEDLQATHGTSRSCPCCGVSRHVPNARCQINHKEHV